MCVCMLYVLCMYVCVYVCTYYVYFVYLVSERSERDTYRGNTIENRGCLFIYIQCFQLKEWIF